MKPGESGAGWEELSAGVARELKAWRAAHPRATLREIEAALDERWARARAQIVEEAAETSALTDLARAEAAGVEVVCPECGGPVRDRGRAVRRLRTPGDRSLRLERSSVVCSACGTGHFPPG